MAFSWNSYMACDVIYCSHLFVYYYIIFSSLFFFTVGLMVKYINVNIKIIYV